MDNCPDLPFLPSASTDPERGRRASALATTPAHFPRLARASISEKVRDVKDRNAPLQIKYPTTDDEDGFPGMSCRQCRIEW
jgi:hypothetical protein